MFTITAKDFTASAIDFEGLRTALVRKCYNTGRDDYTEWEDWFYAVDPWDLYDDEPAPTPREVTEENLKEFASWVLDASHVKIIAGVPPRPETLQALHEFMGWSLEEAADILDVSLRTYQRWLTGEYAAPSGIEGELRRACQHLIERAKLLAATNTIEFDRDMDGAERRAHAMAEAMFVD